MNQENIRHGVDVDALYAAHAAYLQSRAAFKRGSDEDRFLTSRIFAELELGSFLNWLKEQPAEPLRPRQAAIRADAQLDDGSAMLAPASALEMRQLDGLLRALRSFARTPGDDSRRALALAVDDLLVRVDGDEAGRGGY